MKKELKYALGALVVTAVLAVVLFPVFAGAHAGRGHSCFGNISQLDHALLMYDWDYDGLPPARSWMDAIRPFVRLETVYHCPDVVRENRFAYGYAIETQLGGVEVRGLDRPSKEPMVFDSFPLGRNAHTKHAIIPGFSRHGGQNVGYADGHARFVKGR